MPAPDIVADLVKRFEDNLETYRSGQYNEAQVRQEFLTEIEGWRDLLARHIALRNPGISQRDLNFAVQRIIDRIVFLRICEDRGIEPYGTLQALVNGPSVYRRLGELFERADQRYNSGLFLQADYGVGLRDLISRRKALAALVDFGCAQVFPRATTYTCLLFLSGSPRKGFVAKFNTRNLDPPEVLASTRQERIRSQALASGPWMLTARSEARVVEKVMTRGRPLREFIRQAITGVKTGANSIFVFDAERTRGKVWRVRPEGLDRHVEIESVLLRPFWKAESMKRYRASPSRRLLLYPYEQCEGRTVLIDAQRMGMEFPRAWEYLAENRRALEARQKGKLRGPGWYGLSFASSMEMFLTTKIVTPTLAPRNSFAMDSDGNFFPQGAGGGCGLVPHALDDAPYLLSVLNSRLCTFYFQRISSRFQGGWYAYEPRYLDRLSVCVCDPAIRLEAFRRQKMVELAQEILSLRARPASPRTPHEKTALERQLQVAERQIDQLVYELYGLTDEEIRIVEEATLAEPG